MLHSTTIYRGYTIEIHYDEYPESPLEMYDVFTNIISFSSRFELGNCTVGRVKGNRYHFYGREDFERWVQENRNQLLLVPLYTTSHSNSQIEIHWTSRQGGPEIPPQSWQGYSAYAFVTKSEIRKHYGVRRISHYTLESAHRLMKAEVEQYNAYLTGEVFAWVALDPDKEIIPDGECSGYYGSGEEKHMLQTAQQIIDAHIAHTRLDYDVIKLSPGQYTKKLGRNCPACDATDPVQFGSILHHDRMNGFEVIMKCNACESRWIANYPLQGYTNLSLKESDS